MTDVVTPAVRSRMMSGIRGKNTRPEMLIRRFLHGRGLRYRLHDRKLPGTPDLVFPKYGTVIFIHGCFWHRHEGCKYASMPATNVEFWQTKFAGNVRRDREAVAVLQNAGWRVIVLWECGLRHVSPERDLDWLSDAVTGRRGELLEWPAFGR